jgi:hypothetical protein
VLVVVTHPNLGLEKLIGEFTVAVLVTVAVTVLWLAIGVLNF